MQFSETEEETLSFALMTACDKYREFARTLRESGDVFLMFDVALSFDQQVADCRALLNKLKQ